MARTLRDEEDAFGRQLLDYLGGDAAEATLERDDGVAGPSLAPAAFFADWSEWSAEERRVFENVRGRVLDVGCGAGRHSLEAQRRGHGVLAIDISPGAIAVCRQRGVEDARLLSLADVDRDLGEFDTVLMMCGNFGLLGTVEQAPRILRSLHEVTSDDGAIVLDSVDARQTTNPKNLAYHERNRARGMPPGQVRLRLRYGERVTPWFDLLNLGPDELAAVVAGTGWFLADVQTTQSSDYYAVLRKA